MKQIMKFGLILLLVAALVTTGTASGPLLLEKIVMNNPVPYGTPAYFRIILTNPGDYDLHYVQTFDEMNPGCNDNWGDLPARTSGWYDCPPSPPVYQSYVNTIRATYTNGQSFETWASAEVIVSGCQPGIDVSIDPKLQTVGYGGTASWTVKVKNTGTCPLNSVSVTDTNTAAAATATVNDAGCSKKIGTLDAGAESTYTCSQANVMAAFKKVVVATGKDAFMAEWTDTDFASVVVAPCNPAISLVGTPAAQFVHSGGTAKWKITVKNTGDTDLTGVAVSGSVCKKTIGALKVGATSTYSCSKAGYKRGTSNNIYTYPLKAKGTACGITMTANDALWVTVKP